MIKYQSEINGHLDLFTYKDIGEEETSRKIMIHGDSEGLISLAELLIKIAQTNQEEIQNLPIGAREHIHLEPQSDLSNSSQSVIIGRLDAKGTGEFYKRYTAKKP